MATATDGRKAHGILLGYEPLSKHGYCWYYVWRAYAAAGASTSMGSTPTALAAWNVTQGRHPGDWNPPAGAAIWLGKRYDGNADGDVFIAGEYDGDHAATDQPSWGQTGTTSIRARMNLTGREYLGWSDHVLDCPITTGGTVPPVNPETEELTDMFIAIDPSNGWWLVIPQGKDKPRAVILGANSIQDSGSLPVIRFEWDASFAALQGAVDGL